MTRQAIIDRAVNAISQLPEEKAEAVGSFAEFLVRQHEEQILAKGIAHLATNGKAFDFLHHEEDLYTEADIKEPYDG